MGLYFTSANSQFLRLGSPIVTAWPFTVSLWGWLPNTSAIRCAFGLGTSGGTDQYVILYVGTDGKVYAAKYRSDTAPEKDAVTSVAVQTSTWFHAAGVWASNTDMRVLLNGSNKGTQAASCAFPTVATETSLSSVLDTGTTRVLYWNGGLADVGVWNVALDDWEIAALASGFRPSQVRVESLIAHWPLLYSGEDIAGMWNMLPGTIPTGYGDPFSLNPRSYATPKTRSAAARKLSLDRPLAGDLIVGDTALISVSKLLVGGHKILRSDNAGSTFPTSIASGIAGADQSYTVAGPVGTQVRFRAETDDGGPDLTSDTPVDMRIASTMQENNNVIGCSFIRGPR